MKLSIGYSLIATDRFNEAVVEFRNEIAEIYFSWPGMASGRSDNISTDEEYKSKVQKLIQDLLRYAELGIPLVILFNANCYGEKAVSEELADSIISTIKYVNEQISPLSAVTTASPFIAWTVKKYFPDLQTRTSVNMKMSRVESMEYLSDRFDFFYLAKELNRDLKEIKIIKKWADENNKGIGILANSGCLNYCSNQVFHDNLVAHESEIENFTPAYYQPVQCRRFIGNTENWNYLLHSSNWIRPEDLVCYKDLFTTVKLATRMHAHPFMVIGAYSSGEHRGNIIDLMEPAFSQILYPYILENDAFPEGWSTKHCSRRDAEILMTSVSKSVHKGVLAPNIIGGGF